MSTTWNDVETIYSYDTGGYDWSSVEVLVDRRGDEPLYAVYTDGGCSCNYAREMDLEYYDLSWTPRLDEAFRWGLEGINSLGSYDITPAEKVTERAALRQAIRSCAK